MQARCPFTQGTQIIVLIVALIIVSAVTPQAFAQETVVKATFSSPSDQPIPVNVLTGQSCLVLFDKPIGRITISNLETAESVLVAPNQMVVNGKMPGRARFVAWDKLENQFIFLDVDVRANLAQIDTQIRALFPKEDIRLSQANGSVVLSGNATSQRVAQQAESVIQAAGLKTVNLLEMPVQNMTQVQLQIRVAEVSRNKLSEYAFTPVYQSQPGVGGYSNTGQGPYSLAQVDQGNIIGSVAQSLNLFVMTNNAFAFLRALQQNGALRALAEPNLIAMNGQQASFLAGGEFPIPVIQGASQQGAVTIVYKEYGVRLNFKPTILDENHIRLELEPEVSTIDYANAIRFSGFLIPALRTRRAKTGIELQDGQSFGMAGLLDNNEIKSLSKIPLIGDVPWLGELFKSKSLQRNETEVLFIVTAKLTKPLNPDALPQMRGVDGLKSGSPLGIDKQSDGLKDKSAQSSDQKTATSNSSIEIKQNGTGVSEEIDGNDKIAPVGETGHSVTPGKPTSPTGSGKAAGDVKSNDSLTPTTPTKKDNGPLPAATETNGVVTTNNNNPNAGATPRTANGVAVSSAKARPASAVQLSPQLKNLVWKISLPASTPGVTWSIVHALTSVKMAP
jgi:pilus assembly protein CpaC